MSNPLNAALALAHQAYEELVRLASLEDLARAEFGSGAKRAAFLPMPTARLLADEKTHDQTFNLWSPTSKRRGTLPERQERSFRSW